MSVLVTPESIQQRRERLQHEELQIRKDEEALKAKQREVEAEAQKAVQRVQYERVQSIKRNIVRNIVSAITVLLPRSTQITFDDNALSSICIGDRRTHLDINKVSHRTTRWSLANPGVSMYDVHVNRWNEGRRFPAKKDGTHSYDKIAQFIVDSYNEQLTKHNNYVTAEQHKVESTKLVEALNIEFNVRSAWRSIVEASTYDGTKVVVKIGSLHATPDQARLILRMLRDNNLKDIA